MFPDGVVLVDLAPLRDDGHVLSALTAALGVPETAGQRLADALVDHLAGRSPRHPQPAISPVWTAGRQP